MAAGSLASPEIIVVVAGCATGSAFLIRFLIALLVDDKHARRVHVMHVTAPRQNERMQLVRKATYGTYHRSAVQLDSDATPLPPMRLVQSHYRRAT